MRLLSPHYVFLLACVGCAAVPKAAREMPLVTRSGYQGVVIPIEMAQSQSGLSRRYDGFWLPDSRDVMEAESAIAAHLAEAETNEALGGYTRSRLPTIRENLVRYRRQYVGVLLGDEKRIYCNVLTPDRRRYRDWRTKYIFLIEHDNI